MSNLDSLRRSTADLARKWTPELFDAGSERLGDLLSSLAGDEFVVSVFDTIMSQVAELIETRNPGQRLTAEAMEREVEGLLCGRGIDEYGTWVYYPWARALVHILPESAFRELRTSRNRFKITQDEQNRLLRLRIGVIGLSVGRATAVTMAMEGVGGEFVLADFDVLALSNMNRIRGRVTDLGLPKTILTAREIAELDPYLKVTPFPAGVTEENLDSFLLEPRKLDVLIEECDDLFVKVRVRERCRELGIPVVMETSDRGLIDIERFDLEPSRPILHGLLADVRASDLKGLSTREKIPFVLSILDDAMLSPRMSASLVEIDESVTTWPQLASAISLGSGIATDTVRRIALGDLTCSGRFYIDLDDAICDGRQYVPQRKMGLVSFVGSSNGDGFPELRRLPEPPSRQDVRTLVHYATAAPSGGNCQPWRFVWDGTTLRCFLDRPRSVFDIDASYLAMGAAVENLTIAASKAGLVCETDWFPDDTLADLVSQIRVIPGTDVGANPLVDQILKRRTNRKDGLRVVLPSSHAASLTSEAQGEGARVTFETSADKVALIADVVAKGDRIRLLSRPLLEEFARELRWTPEEVSSTGDGLDIATLELDAADRAGLRIISRKNVMEFVGSLGGGRALERTSRRAINSSCAVGLVTVHGSSPLSFVIAGRAVQRMWLKATALGYDLHPMTAVTYLFRKVARGDCAGLSEAHLEEIRALWSTFSAVFPMDDEESSAMLFRLVRAESPTARSLRRPVDDVLSFV